MGMARAVCLQPGASTASRAASFPWQLGKCLTVGKEVNAKTEAAEEKATACVVSEPMSVISCRNVVIFEEERVSKTCSCEASTVRCCHRGSTSTEQVITQVRRGNPQRLQESTCEKRLAEEDDFASQQCDSLTVFMTIFHSFGKVNRVLFSPYINSAPYGVRHPSPHSGPGSQAQPAKRELLPIKHIDKHPIPVFAQQIPIPPSLSTAEYRH